MVVKVSKPELNLRDKINDLDKPSGVAGEAMLRAETIAEQQALIGVGNRNILVNGSFQISQRGDYSSASATSLNNYVFKLDRWNNHTITITSTVQHLSGFPTTNEKYVRTVATSTGSGYMRMFQRVEGNFEGRELTFSAWVRSNRPTRLLTICTGAWLSNDTSARHSGNGQWEKLTLTATAGNFNNPHFAISNNAIDHGATDVVTGDYFEVANCQLEEGKIATPFEYRTYGQELEMCQRFFQIVEAAAGHASSTSAVEFTYQFNTARAAKFILTNFSGLTAGNAYSYEGNHSSSGHITLDSEL